MRVIGWTIAAYVTAMFIGATALVMNYMLLGAGSSRPLDYMLLAFLSVAGAFLVVGFPFYALARLVLALLGAHSIVAFGGMAAVFGVVAGTVFGIPDAVFWDADRFTPTGTDTSLAEIVRANSERGYWFVFQWLSPITFAFSIVVGTGMGIVYLIIERLGWPKGRNSRLRGVSVSGSGDVQ